jgi:hypothetical protein
VPRPARGRMHTTGHRQLRYVPQFSRSGRTAVRPALSTPRFARRNCSTYCTSHHRPPGRVPARRALARVPATRGRSPIGNGFQSRRRSATARLAQRSARPRRSDCLAASGRTSPRGEVSSPARLRRAPHFQPRGRLSRSAEGAGARRTSHAARVASPRLGSPGSASGTRSGRSAAPRPAGGSCRGSCAAPTARRRRSQAERRLQPRRRDRAGSPIADRPLWPKSPCGLV